MKRGLLVILLLLTFTPASAQDSGWTLISANTLEQFAGDDYRYENPILSPDGTQVAWTEQLSSCVYTFATNTTECSPWPRELRIQPSRFNLPVWSPDSTRIIYHENFFLMFIDSDLWRFDVESGQFLDWTNDLFLGGVLDDDFNDKPIDYLPTWNQMTGELYFMRSQRVEDAAEDESNWTLGLHRMVGNRADLILDLTNELPPLPVFRPMAFSPDGTTLALIILPANFALDPASGIWLLDLETATLEQVASLDDMQVGLPSWQETPVVPSMVAWAQGGLVIHSSDMGSSFISPLHNSYYVELPSGVVTPLVDFSAFPTRDDYIEALEAGPSAASDSHLAGAVSPDGGTYWYLGRTTPAETTTLYQVSLPPTGDAPQPLGRVAYRPHPRQEALPTVSADGKVLFYNFLFTFEQE